MDETHHLFLKLKLSKLDKFVTIGAGDVIPKAHHWFGKQLPRVCVCVLHTTAIIPSYTNNIHSSE